MGVGTMAGTTGHDAVPKDTAGRKGKVTRNAPPPASGAVYGLGMIGALVYFLASAKTPADVVLALAKSMVWPSLLVYRAFKVLGG